MVSRGEEFWRVKYVHPADSPPPDCGDRALTHVIRAASSTAVTVPLGGGRFLTAPAP